MSEYFACRDNHILKCLVLVKLLQFLIHTSAAEKKKRPLFKICPLKYMSSIEDNICSLHVPLSGKHGGYRPICTHFCRLRQDTNPWKLACFHNFFFLSFTVKNSFSYRLSTSERIWHSIWRGCEGIKSSFFWRKRQDFCYSAFAQGLLKLWNCLLSITLFSFWSINKYYLAKQLTKWFQLNNAKQEIWTQRSPWILSKSGYSYFCSEFSWSSSFQILFFNWTPCN